MGEQFYVTCWLDECLIALPCAKFEQIFSRLSESGMVKNRGLRRMLYAGAVEAQPDKQGRILLPPPAAGARRSGQGGCGHRGSETTPNSGAGPLAGDEGVYAQRRDGGRD